MPAVYRTDCNNQKNSIDIDDTICQEDGIYCPTFNIVHKELVKAGQPFPLYRGKKVRWILLDKINDFVCKK